MIGPEPDWETNENAHVVITESGNKIDIMLADEGNSYYNGYLNFEIYVNGELVKDLSEVGYWTVGESILIGSSYSGYEVDGSPLSSGEYDVTVVISNTVIYDGEISI